MSDLYSKIDLLKQQASQTASETSGLPPGYVAGFALSLTDGRILVGPGTANVQGRAVSLPASRYINDDEWISKSKLASTIYYIYLRFTGDFFVDLVAPTFITGQYGNYHADLGFLYIGKAKTNTAGAISIVASHDAIIAEQADFDEVFVIAAQSPNYVAGADGWAINEDGSAEFNDISLRGTITQKVSIAETEVKVQGSEFEGSLRTTVKEDGARVQEYDSGAWTTKASLLQTSGTKATSEVYYAFEDDVTDSGTAADDGTAYGTPTYVTGQVGKAISLNGTDQYVTMPNVANRLYCGAGLDWTVGLWIYPKNTAGFGDILAKYSTSGTNAYIFRLTYNANYQRIDCGIRYNGVIACFSTQPNAWVHFALSWDGTTAKVYKNGTYIKDLTTYTTNPDSSAQPIALGYVDSHFNGYIDELRIVPTSTVAGVLDLYQNGTPGATVLAADTVTATTSISTPSISSPNADLYGFRAWALFDMTAGADLAGTYVRVGTTVTVTAALHGHKAGHRFYFNATSGTAADGSFEILTVPTADTLTFTHVTSGDTSGACVLERVAFTGGGNISAVPYVATGYTWINFDHPMPDTNYGIIVDNTVLGTTGVGALHRIHDAANKTVNGFYLVTTDGSGVAANFSHVTVMIVR